MSTDRVASNHTHPHACCSIIPTYILSRIADHPHAPAAARTHARNSLAHTHSFSQNRLTFNRQINSSGGYGGGQGIPGPGRFQQAAGGQTAYGSYASAANKRLNRVVYSANNTKVLDMVLIRGEGQSASNDASANECFDGFGATFAFFSDVLGRNSINDNGMTLTGTVHYDQNYSNALWNGAQMIFGDGDGGVYWNRFTAALDVIAHELTHGVTAYTANLTYQGQSGALNESMSDVFGSMVKQYHLKQTASQADWIIGAGLFTSRVNGVGLRSMRAPGTAYDDPVVGKDEQVANYAEMIAKPLPDSYDAGGVHIYSGIPNRAFYLTAVALGGYSWDRAGRIWYATLTDTQLKPDCDFKTFAELTCKNAEALFGANVKAVVEQAWSDVGLYIGSRKKVPHPVEGTWTGYKSGQPMECVFTVSGTTLQGWGSMTNDGRTTSFNIANGYTNASGTLRFTVVFNAPNSSNEEFDGSVWKPETISGLWESSDRQAYINAGWPDSDILHGVFGMTKRAY